VLFATLVVQIFRRGSVHRAAETPKAAQI